jgi:microcystin-dependent protein
MSQPFVGEIRMFGGNFAPVGWAFCNGQLMPISENETLFQLIGTTYGGDGQETFALPNLQSRVPVHQGTGPEGMTFIIGETGGVESVTLTVNQIPNHQHLLLATNLVPQLSPLNNVPATATSTQAGVNVYGPSSGNPVTLPAACLQPTGGSQPHDNMQPFLVISFIISLFGVFPSQT